MLTRRDVLRVGAVCAAARPLRAWAPVVKVFDVARYGAAGDGTTPDGAAFQRAIDEAAEYLAGERGARAQVLVRGGRKYVVGTLELKGAIDFHLADDAELLASTRREDYLGGLAGSAAAETMGSAGGALIVANGVQGLRISGTGKLNGRAREFMTGYDEANEWWLPKEFRPKMFVLTECRDLEVRDITFAEAPSWGLHMLGCERVLVDGVKVRNLLDVPNCDGIDPDHSRFVEIRNCDIVAGDDGVVVKCSRQAKDYGAASNIYVHDCVIETQDAGLKIGTETTADVHDVIFERCRIKTSSRGLCIQLRDEGSVYNVKFRNIQFEARYYSDPWWGRGEAISFTALPRKAGGKIGIMHHIQVKNVTGRAENSVRVWGSPESRAHDIVLERVDVTLDRWTKFKGGLYDNRPTTAMEPTPEHRTVGYSFRDVDRLLLKDSRLRWGVNRPEYFAEAIEAQDVTGLRVKGFEGKAVRVGLKSEVVS